MIVLITKPNATARNDISVTGYPSIPYGRERAHALRSRDLRRREHPQIRRVRQHIDHDRSAQSEPERQWNVAPRIPDLARDEADGDPSVVRQQAGDHGDAEIAGLESH